jgi:hypothetical protein
MHRGNGTLLALLAVVFAINVLDRQNLGTTMGAA